MSPPVKLLAFSGTANGQQYEFHSLNPGANLIGRALAGDLAFDTVIRSSEDLPLPVAGVITLPSGSYVFSEDLDITPNRIVLPGTFRGSISGQAPGAILSSDVAGPLIEAQASAQFIIDRLRFMNPSGDGIQVSNDGFVNAAIYDCEITDCNVCINLLSGELRVAGTRCANFGAGLQVATGAECALDESFFISGDSAVIMFGGSILMTNCRCRNLNTGLRVQAGGADSIQIAQCRFDFLGNAIQGGPGVIGVSLVACRFRFLGAAINWAVVDTPSNGFAMHACDIDNGAVSVGINQASPRVIWRGNLNAGALLSETVPLVP